VKGCASVRIDYLADHPAAVPLLRQWFETEWTAYYGPSGPGDAEQDVLAYSSRDTLPIGLVAFDDNQLCGIAVLRADSIRTHSHLGPWVAAGFVLEPFRGRGIGARLIRALEDVARARGYSTIYAATSTATRLFERSGWELLETVRDNDEELSIYRKGL
jgi:GNAT superfamily N-acetyltransferase